MVHNFIRSHLKKRISSEDKAKSSLSLRSLAKQMNVSPGALSEYLREKRTFSRQTVERVLSQLRLTREEQLKMQSYMNPAERGRQVIQSHQNKVLSHWSYFAILALFDLDNPPQTIDEIVFKLCLPKELVKSAIDVLIELSFLRWSQEQILERIPESLTTLDGMSSESIRTFHAHQLELAAVRLNQVRVENRDFTSITFAGSSEKLTEVMAEVRKFREKLYSLMNHGPKDHIYTFSSQLFPVTALEDEGRQ